MWDVARPHMEKLVAQTNESTSMAQLDEGDIVYVARVAVPKIVTLAVTIGTRFPATATSMGKVLLAAQDLDDARPRAGGAEPVRHHAALAAHAERAVPGAARGAGPGLGAGRPGPGARHPVDRDRRSGTATARWSPRST